MDLSAFHWLIQEEGDRYMAGKSSLISSQASQQLGTKEQVKCGSSVLLTPTDILYHFTYLHANVWSFTPAFNIHFINKVQTVLN